MKIWKQKQFSLNTETIQKIDELAELLDRKKIKYSQVGY